MIIKESEHSLLALSCHREDRLDCIGSVSSIIIEGAIAFIRVEARLA